jgi:hypothetical protein
MSDSAGFIGKRGKKEGAKRKKREKVGIIWLIFLLINKKII